MRFGALIGIVKHLALVFTIQAVLFIVWERVRGGSGRLFVFSRRITARTPESHLFPVPKTTHTPKFSTARIIILPHPKPFSLLHCEHIMCFLSFSFRSLPSSSSSFQRGKRVCVERFRMNCVDFLRVSSFLFQSSD